LTFLLIRGIGINDFCISGLVSFLRRKEERIKPIVFLSGKKISQKNLFFPYFFLIFFSSFFLQKLGQISKKIVNFAGQFVLNVFLPIFLGGE